MSFKGGSLAAKERVQYYCSEPERLGQYKQTRNGMVGADYSSKFSPWLSVGSISPVEIYHAIRDYEELHGANESSYWLIFELLWRDFFQYTLWVHGDKVFQYDGFGKGRGPLKVSNETALSNWCEGRTGNDFVDACMRELVATGFMSNRGRQNVASYLVHDLQQDWRRGAEFFEYHLLDYDVASNWCNWAYIAGVGNDPRAGRRFNIDKQASDYDPNHTFRNHWKDGSK
jgi:deoxyribodipyrimidine photo-lyase